MDETRMFRARMAKVLLGRIREMPKEKVRRMQRHMRRLGLAIERQDIHPAHLFATAKSSGPVRFGTGYIYR